MFLTHRKGLILDGSHPTMLYGYGGFNIVIKPVFSPSRIVFLQHFDGVVAVPNLRGGDFNLHSVALLCYDVISKKMFL